MRFFSRAWPSARSARRRSTFSQVFSGHVGLDPYTTAVSDVYQDLFGEGSYVGKGIYDVDAFERALHGRVPDNALLSHDLFEGLYRAGRALHRPRSHRRLSQPLPDVGRAASSVGARRLAAAAVARRTVPTRAARACETRCRPSRAGKLPTTCGEACCRSRWSSCWRRAGSSFRAGRRCGRARRSWCCSFPRTFNGGRRSPTACGACGCATTCGQSGTTWRQACIRCCCTARFSHTSRSSWSDAIGRTLVRLFTRRHLLEWETAADTAARLQGEWPLVLRRMWIAPVMAMVMAAVVLALAAVERIVGGAGARRYGRSRRTSRITRACRGRTTVRCSSPAIAASSGGRPG